MHLDLALSKNQIFDLVDEIRHCYLQLLNDLLVISYLSSLVIHLYGKRIISAAEKFDLPGKIPNLSIPA